MTSAKTKTFFFFLLRGLRTFHEGNQNEEVLENEL